MPPSDQPPWVVEFYRDRRGRIPVEDFLNTLPVRERLEVLRVIDLLEVAAPQREMALCAHCVIETARRRWAELLDQEKE
jgi:hypothetical protein